MHKLERTVRKISTHADLFPSHFYGLHNGIITVASHATGEKDPDKSTRKFYR